MRQRTLLITAVLCLSGIAARAQSSNDHFFRTTGPVDRTQYKLVLQHLNDIDPNAQAFLSDDLRIVQVKRSNVVSEADVRAAIAAAGVELQAGTPDVSAYLNPPLDPGAAPVYVVTGDDQGDAERYRAAVATWNQVHPDQQIALPYHMTR